MKLKDRLIRKLLDAGKKHRILVYPTLALIAIISAISHMVYWGRGNGKKVMASVMVMVMLITQSIFLTSSADVVDENPEQTAGTETTGEELVDDGGIAPYAVNNTPANTIVNYYRVDETGQNAYPIPSGYPIQPQLGDDGVSVVGYKINVLSEEALLKATLNTEDVTDQAGCFEVSGIYFDQACSKPVVDGTIPEDGSVQPEDGAYKVYFKATRKAYPVTISDDKGVLVTATVEANPITTGDIYPPAAYKVPQASDANMNLYRYGYLFDKVTLEGGGTYDVTETTVVSIDPSVAQPMDSISLTANWTGMEFYASFWAKDTDTPADVVIVGDSDGKMFSSTYDASAVFPSATEMWATSDAYELTGWKDEYGNTYNISADGTVVKPDGTVVIGADIATDITDGAGIKANPNVTGKKLTAVWTYKGIELLNYGSATEDGNSVSVTSSYGEQVDLSLSAQYKDGTASQFVYGMTDEDRTTLGNYGLSISTPDGAFNITGALNNVTPEGGITVYLSVTDTKKGDTDNVTTYPITIVSNKRQVAIDPSSVTNENGSSDISREYNGSDIISVGERAELILADGQTPGTGKLATDDVYVTVSPTAKVDPNAGDNKSITLQGVTLTGAQASKYELTGFVEGTTNEVVVDGVADITPKSLKVGIKFADPDKSSVRFGEATPEFTLYLLEPEKLTSADKTAYDNCATDAAKMQFVSEKLGYIGADTSRQLYSSPGTYTIKPEFSSEGKNYAAYADGLSLSFTVTRDAGVMYSEDGSAGANFKMSTSKSDNGYYPGLVISGYGEYTHIRRIDTASGDVTPSMTYDEVKALFGDTTAITIEDMVDKTIYFQMYNPQTGAVSQIVTLTNVNVDTSAPTLEGYKVTPAPNSEYFKEFSFGSYYHSQPVDGVTVENVTLTFNYKTDGSDCESLFYSFVDENGNPISDQATEVKLMKDATTGVYSCSFTIGTGKYGQLIVYATDTTGNTSTPMKIKLNADDAEAFDPTEEQTPEDYYEWMVENKIDGADIVAMDGENLAATDVWYNDLKLVVDAADEDSGVDKIVWTVTGPNDYKKSYTDIATSSIASVFKEYGKILNCKFVHTLNDEELPAGAYFITAVLEDNAGNTVELEGVGPYLIDTKKPVITDNTDTSQAAFESSVMLDFTVTEGEDESGVSTVELYLSNGTEKVHVKSWLVQDSYTYEIVSNGTYVIEATDKAGNVQTHTMSFDNISNVAPSDPIITVDGTKGDNGWYVGEEPEVTITYEDMTSDGVEVESYYSVTAIVGESTNTTERVLSPSNNVFTIDDEGTVTISAWSISDSGKESGVSTAELKVDLTAPDIQITDSVANEEGDLVISFRITDKVSGVDDAKVMINGTPVEVTVEDDAVVGTFVAEDNEYELTAVDMAGNKATYEFEPLYITVNPVTDITSSGAYLEAFVYEGSYDIQDAYIAIKKDGESAYVSTLYNKNEEDYGLSMNALFRNLDADSVYWYKVYAKAEVSGEVKVIEGSFRTTNDKATGAVSGTVLYGEDTTPVYPIYVSLYDGNTVIQTDIIEDETDKSYQFNKIADGAYNIVATNGYVQKTSAVTLENGGVTYPTNYAINSGIHFVLNNMSTSVVIEDNSIDLTADGLETIYNTSWYEGNITTADKAVLADGGSIEIELHANYMDVTELSTEEQNVFASKLDDNAIIERYIQLYVVKEVRDKDGRLVNGTPTLIPELYDPITISFPLGDLAGQKIYVASVHGEGSNYTFFNWDTADEVKLSNDYVTITTKHFSVYALYRTIEVPKEYTVKWVDGDGRVMKTETVLEGGKATPPTEIPTKKATDKYTYSFSGWDTTYDNITQDTIIAAWFTANKVTVNTPDNNNNPVAPDADVKPGTPDSGNKTDDGKVPDNKYTYMGSADSPSTGDEMPIVILLVMMLASVVGLVVLRKKNIE